MIKILINRLIQSVPVILGAVTISFVMIHIAPGDPVIAILGEQYNPEDAKEGTIRKDFASSLSENAVHGADSDENALIEIGFFFSEGELISNQ